ncbi:MAG: AAA family ATPase [Pseudomonadales bacterium]
MALGQIIFLNGTSSAGKTTLAHALQEVLPEPYLHVALDHFRDGLPARFRGLNAPPGTDGARGLNVVPVERDGRMFTEIRFGDTGRKVLRGMRRATAAMVREGINVIIDDVILDPAFLDDYLQVFAGFQVYFVGVKCTREVLGKRERARPGRFPGTATGHYEVCHAHGNYDVEVDTSTMPPDQCAEQVRSFISRNQPTAFTELSALRKSSKGNEQ